MTKKAEVVDPATKLAPGEATYTKEKAPSPTVGRIVLYIDAPGQKPVPAIVQAVDEKGDVTCLVVLHENRIEFVRDVPTKGEAQTRHWHWPTRV